METLKLLFWICSAAVLYPYVLYPTAIAVMARLRGRPVHAVGRFEGSVSVVLAAYNEEVLIVRRLSELISLLAASGREGEIVVVSDGSTDKTPLFARSVPSERVRVLELALHVGKAEALTAACAAARGDIVVFADVRQRWAPDALENLLQKFTDPEVGGVSGDLRLDAGSGLTSGVGLYWRFEKWLRRTESLLHSTVGVTGAISAVRRELFRPIPSGVTLDDVYWPLRVAMQGYRVVHEEKAVAFDRLPRKAGDEFRRKLRTLSGNFQLLTQLPAALLPWRNPIWFQFLAHKIMRLVVPWALLGMLIVSVLLPEIPYRTALVGQLAFYCLGLIGILQHSHTQIRLTSAAGSFLVLNAAAWVAFWVWITGKATNSWRKVNYDLAENQEAKVPGTRLNHLASRREG